MDSMWICAYGQWWLTLIYVFNKEQSFGRQWAPPVPEMTRVVSLWMGWCPVPVISAAEQAPDTISHVSTELLSLSLSQLLTFSQLAHRTQAVSPLKQQKPLPNHNTIIGLYCTQPIHTHYSTNGFSWYHLPRQCFTPLLLTLRKLAGSLVVKSVGLVTERLLVWIPGMTRWKIFRCALEQGT